MNVKERAAHLLLDYAVNLQEAHAPDGKWRGDEAEHSYRNLVETAKGIHHGVHLITEAPIEPDKEGFWIHPGMPDHLDEDPRPFHEWLDEQLLKCATAEVGDENGDLDSDWADTKPAGFGWFLLALMDTEDGPTAFWVRREFNPANPKSDIGIHQPLPWGEEPSVSLTHNGKTFAVDASIAPIVEALNAGGVPTVASCSGHGKTVGVVSLKDGRELLIAVDFEAARAMERTLSDIHGMTREERAVAFRNEQERAYRTICRERDQLAEYAATQALDLRDGGDCVCASTEAWRALPPGLQELVNHEQERLDPEREDPANG